MVTKNIRPACARRHILIATREQIETSKRNGEFGIFSNPEVWTVTFEEPPQSEFISKLMASPNFFPGALLSKSPFSDDRYYPLPEFSHSVSHEKLSIICNLCSLLGAVRVHGREEVNEGEQKEATGDGGFELQEVPVGSVGVEVRREHRSGMRLVVSESFKGGEPDVEAARAYLIERNLDGDVHLSSLIEKAANSRNALVSCVLEIEINREARTALSMVAGLDLPNFLVNIKGQLKAQTTSARNLSIEIDF